MRKLTPYELNSIRTMINAEINVKLNVLLSLVDSDVAEAPMLREIVKAIVERSIMAWGFTPDTINVIGPNDDSKFTIDFTIDISKENSLIG